MAVLRRFALTLSQEPLKGTCCWIRFPCSDLLCHCHLNLVKPSSLPHPCDVCTLLCILQCIETFVSRGGWGGEASCPPPLSPSPQTPLWTVSGLCPNPSPPWQRGRTIAVWSLPLIAGAAVDV
eukprot:EG_transcript_32701